jgi:hypothetical protein
MSSVAVSQKSYTAYAQWRVANGRRSRERHANLSPRYRRHSIVQSSLLPVDNYFQLCRPYIAIEETLSEGDAPVPLKDIALFQNR